MLEKDSFQIVDELFDAVLDLPAEDRAAYLQEHSPNDEVRRQVEELLKSLESAEIAPGGAISGAFGENLRSEMESDSSITPGSSLGDYQIQDLLGAGGMGEVYRARDTKLRREVAIKVLADDALAPEQLERFDREARALAAVNHPHIGAIYGLEREEDRPYLVLELVPGTTLSERLDARPLPIRKAIAVAAQIAGALEAAHAAGIVHRDLKPANIKISEDSQVKVLDFGLAKSDALSVAEDETVPAATRPGVILGTAGYMSPEQARGAVVDRRADNWAFGCVLFEMLTGKKAFPGKTPSDTLAAVLREEPPWQLLPDETPEIARRLLERCLKKDAHRRLQHIGDARVELEEWLDYGEETAPKPATAPRFAWLPWAVAAVLAAVFAWTQRETGDEPVRTAASLHLLPPAGTEFWSHYSTVVNLSPDGEQLAFVAIDTEGRQELYLRRLDGPEAIRVEGSEGAHGPFFSPDGQWIGFFSQRQLKKVSADGKTTVTLAEVGGNSRGAAWGDGFIVFAQTQTTPLQRISDEGGTLEPLTQLDEAQVERSHRWPQIVGDAVLFTAQPVGSLFDDAAIVIQSLTTGERKTLVSRAGFARLLPDGRLAYTRAGRVYTVVFDDETWEVSGSPELILEGVSYDARNGGTQFSFSRDGTLIYRPGSSMPEESRPVYVDAEGRAESFGGEERIYNTARWAPDGRRLAASVLSAQSEDLWLIERGSPNMVRVTYDGAQRPVWSPDGRYLLYASGEPGSLDILVTAADGDGTGTRLVDRDGIALPNSWTPDGRYVLFQERHAEQGWNLMRQEVDVREDGVRAVGSPECLRCTPFNEAEARVAPDGSLVTYESDELDNVYQIYVQPFPEMGRKWQLSVGGARRPIFAPGGESVFYWNTSTQGLQGHSVAYDGSALSVGRLQSVLSRGRDLWQAGTRGDPGSTGFGVAEDGRFLMLKPALGARSSSVRESDVIVELGWLDGSLQGFD
ncbi:MAG: protein kinase [Acidobacteriota bacterium]